MELKEGKVKPNDMNVGELYVNFAKGGGDTSFVLEGAEQNKPDWLVDDEDDGFLDFDNNVPKAENRLSSELSELVDDFGKFGLETFDDFYIEGVDKLDYYKAFASYYNAGKNGTDISQVKSTLKNLLPDFQKRGAYLAGQLDAEQSGNVVQNNNVAQANVTKTVNENTVKGPVYFDKSGVATLDNDVAGFIENENSKDMPLKEKGQLDKLGRALKVKIVVSDDVLTENGKKAEGGYGRGVIRISKNSATPVFDVAKHEISHRIKELSPKAFKKYQEYVMKHGSKIGKSKYVSYDVAKMKDTYYSKVGQDLSTDEAIEEIVSDFAEFELMLNEEFINDVAQNEPDLARTIRNWINEIVEKIKETLGVAEPSLERAQQLWENAVRSATKEANKVQKNTTKSGSGKVMYSTGSDSFDFKKDAQDEITSKYHKTVDQVLSGTYKGKDTVLLGYTPDIYQKLGMPSLPFVIGSGHIYSVAKTETEAKSENRFNSKTNYHGLGEQAIKDIYERMQDPVAIIASEDIDPKENPPRSTHSVVAIVDIGTTNKSLFVPIKISAESRMKNNGVNVNILSTAFEKDVEKNIRWAINEENNNDVGFFYIKKEAQGLVPVGVQFPVQIQTAMASNGIVRDFDEKINMRVKNVTESLQFKRWFGDWQNKAKRASKIVNADGTPKIMYRGDNNMNFTVFDRKKSKYSNLYGRGFYFTDSESAAKTYGEPYAFYLRVIKPLQPGERKITKKQLVAFLNEVANNDDYDIWNYGTTDVNEIADSLMAKDDDFSIIQDVSATAIGDMVETIELFNAVNKTKYDGIVTPTETVVFDSNQIKSATYNVGTFDKNNPDIRYSIKIDTEGSAKNNFGNVTLVDGTKLDDLTLAEIFNLKEEDANTTPKLEPFHDTGIDETIGKESKFYGSAMKSENVADETKELIKNVNDIKYYVGITNLETLEVANDKLNKGGSAETLRFVSMDKKNAETVVSAFYF